MLRTGAAVPNERLNHMQMTQSLQGLAVPIVYGTTRVNGKLVWTADFKAAQHNQGGSKGFGTKGSALYTYSASWISLLCQGPIRGINSVWDQSGQYIPQSQTTTFVIPPPTPSAPTLSDVSGGSVSTPTTYYVKITNVSSGGQESAASSESSLALAAYQLLVVSSPASISQADRYNVYVGTASGGETLQNASPISIGTNWTEPGTGLISGAALPGTGGVAPGGGGKPPGPTPVPQWASEQGILMNGAPMTRVLYDYIGGASVPTLSTGQYAVNGSGQYTFSSADSGQTVTITDSFFYNNRFTQELHLIPSSSPYQFEANNGGEAVSPDGQSNVAIFVADNGVRDYTTGTAFTKVSGSPAAGEYSVSISGGYGTYTFNSADANTEVIVSYEYYNYQDDKYAPRTLSVTFFPGLLGQAEWSYLSSSHPDTAVAYNLSAYAAFQQAYLGMSASPPIHTFEVIGMNAIGGGILDASPVDCLYSLLTDENIGIGFPAANIDQASWYNNSNSAQNWCKALSFFISEAIQNQQTVASIASRWLEAFQIAFFYSEGLLKLVPFGDQSASGTLADYAPHVSVVADLTDDDFLPPGKKAADPLKVARSPWADAYNRVQVNFLNRENAYNDDLVYEQDEAMIERFGIRVEPPTSYDFITTPTVAAGVANMRLKRNVTIRNKYSFRLSLRYEYLEPMDIVTITDTRLGINKQSVRITRVQNDAKNGLSITAEDYPGNGYAMPVVNPKQTTPAGHPPHGTSSAEQTKVVIVEALGAGQGRESTRLYIFCTGANSEWAGCTVWASLDGTNYQPIGTVTQPAHVGTLTEQLNSVTANPTGSLNLTTDASSTLGIQLSLVTATNSTVGLSEWSDSTTYAKGQLVVWDTWVWASLVSNTGHMPTLSSPYWQHINASAPSDQSLVSVTAQAAENLATLSAVLAVSSGELTTSGIEFLSYETVSSGSSGPNSYLLTNLYRGAYGTEIQQFPANSLFVRFKDASLTFDVPQGYVGGTVYFRFTAANAMGASTQDVSNAQTFAFEVQGTGVAALAMTTDALSSQGSIPTSGADTSAFSYSIPSAATEVDFWWSAFTLPLTNQTNVSVAASGSSSSPAIDMTGLSPSTSYYFSARYNQLKSAVEMMVSTAVLTPDQMTQWLNADNCIPIFASWNIATPAAGGGGSEGSGGPGTGFCFTGSVRVRTADGWKRFDELGPVTRIVNETGEWDADLIVHDVKDEEVVPIDSGFVTPNHLMRAGDSWIAAGEMLGDALRVRFSGRLYNLHVRTTDGRSQNYIVEPNYVVHNMKIL